MRLFFDTNVLLDHALNRVTGQPLEISYLMLWTQNQAVPIYISPGSLYTFTYVLQKSGVRGKDLKLKIEEYLSLVHICPTDRTHFLEGVQSDFKDFEDAFQYYHGLEAQCDHLITCNIKDFRPHCRKMCVLSPSQFVTQILNKTPGVDF
jgi:hypothetical protein